jgi:hypothetical protein
MWTSTADTILQIYCILPEKRLKREAETKNRKAGRGHTGDEWRTKECFADSPSFCKRYLVSFGFSMRGFFFCI